MKVKISIILLNLIAIAYLLTLNRSESRSNEPLRYDTKLPQVEAEELDGRRISIDTALRGRYGILFYCHGEIPWQRVYYARVLQDRYRSHGDGLQAFLVVHRHLGDQVPQLAKDLAYPVAVDTDDEVRKALRLGPGSDGAFIVSPDGRLKLVRNGIPSRDELRQHVEKLLLGKIFYEPSIVARVGPTMELGAIEATDLDDGATVELRPGQGSIYVVFTAGLCSSCNTEPYYDQLERLVDLVRRRTNLRDRELLLLLSAGYPVAEVAFELGKRGLDLDVFRAKGTLRGLEDDYFTKRTREAGVLVVLFDSQGKVSFIEPIDKALEKLDKEEADYVA